MRKIRLACCWGIFCLLPVWLLGRVWTTQDGAKFEGDLIKYANGTVIIKKTKGGKALYKIDKLSESDQAYVRERFPSGDKKPSAPRPVAVSPKETQPKVSQPAPPKIQRNVQPQQRVVGDTIMRAHNLKPKDKALPLSARVQGSSERVTLESMRGKLVLVHVWSSGHKPSLSHLRPLTQIYQRYKDRGFAIIGLHSQTAEGAPISQRQLSQVEARYGITWPMNNDTLMMVAKQWGFKRVPTYTLIDANGFVLYPGIDIRDLEGEIRRQLRIR